MSRLEKYPKYKDSGVEWIGEIPEEWELKKLKFLGKIYAGLTDKKGDDFSKKNEEDLKPFIPFTNIFKNVVIDENEFQYVRVGDNEDQNIVQKGDLLFLMSSETLEDIGKTALYNSNTKVFLNSFCKGFNVKQEKINSYYLNWLLQSNGYRTYFSIVGRGFTRINIKQDYVNNLLTILPPQTEQTKIANYLDQKIAQIDKAITLKEQLIEKLKERRQVLINDAVTKGLDLKVKMKESGVEWLGEVPEHWEVKRLKYVFKIRKRIAGKLGYDVLSITQQGIKIKDITSGEGQLAMDYSKYQLVYKNEFAMNHMDLLTGYVDISKYDGVISPDYRVFTLEHQNCNKEYFLYLLQMGYKNRIFYAYGQGVSMLGRWRFPSDNFYNFIMPIPPSKEQEEIIEHIKENTHKIDKAISLQEKQIEKLKEYKSLLIDSVVTGKVKIF